MRLWHKDFIHILPKQQLLGQWRECCAIAKATLDGNLNHLLVNKVNSYPIDHLFSYCVLVGKEMERRGIKVNPERILVYFYPFSEKAERPLQEIPQDELFPGWHNERYLIQCLHNLQEKYDCGGISEKEWDIIFKEFPAICL